LKSERIKKNVKFFKKNKKLKKFENVELKYKEISKKKDKKTKPVTENGKHKTDQKNRIEKRKKVERLVLLGRPIRAIGG
jgi:hypothetical protein